MFKTNNSTSLNNLQDCWDDELKVTRFEFDKWQDTLSLLKLSDNFLLYECTSGSLNNKDLNNARDPYTDKNQYKFDTWYEKKNLD